MTDYTYTLSDLLRVVDGDTVDLRLSKTVDFGFGVHEQKFYSGRFRLTVVDTPERGQEGWTQATEFTRAWITRNKSIALVTTHKSDSFGRYLADIFLPSGESLSGELLRTGLAVPYEKR